VWSSSSAAPAPALPQPGAKAEGSLALALLGGALGALVAGLAWWGIVATTRYQVTFVAVAVGWVVAQAVLICCQRRDRVPLQIIASGFTLLSLALSEYFIQRTLFIKEFEDQFLPGEKLPLWDGFGSAREIVQESLKDDPLTGLFWLAAIVTAVVVTGARDTITRQG
jgi:hypothetical protein